MPEDVKKFSGFLFVTRKHYYNKHFMCNLPNRIFRIIGDPRTANELWENRESLEKYLARLKEFWNEDENRWKTEEEIKRKNN